MKEEGGTQEFCVPMGPRREGTQVLPLISHGARGRWKWGEVRKTVFHSSTTNLAVCVFFVQVDLGVTEDLMSCTLTPLMAASQCGHVEVVQELLRGGAKLEVKLQATRWTALMFAVLNNKVRGALVTREVWT